MYRVMGGVAKIVTQQGWSDYMMMLLAYRFIGQLGLEIEFKQFCLEVQKMEKDEED